MSDNKNSTQHLTGTAAATLERLLAEASRMGADAADCLMVESIDLAMSTRKSLPEGIERSEGSGVSLRVWVGARQAVVSSSDVGDARSLAERAVAMAKVATEDPHSTLAPQELLARELPDLDLYDSNEPTPQWLQEQCRAAESAALSVEGITNSEGADAGYGATTVTLATSHGFAGSYRSSHAAISVSVLAGEGTQMERDYEYTMARHVSDLNPAEWVGMQAAARTLRRMNPLKLATCQAPVVFDPRVGRGFISSIASALSGSAVARGTSFLKDDLGKAVAASEVTLIDAPHRLRGLGSKPFDAEGVRGEARALIEAGVITTWLLDVRTANQLGMTSTGHASRGLGSAPNPSTSNLYLQAGKRTPQALMRDVGTGLYVTETFGMGVNLVTGDYSQGAAGFWMEEGELAYPVSEITIAGNLRDMLRTLTPADDLEFRYGANAPTFAMDGMTIAGGA